MGSDFKRRHYPNRRWLGELRKRDTVLNAPTGQTKREGFYFYFRGSPFEKMMMCCHGRNSIDR